VVGPARLSQRRTRCGPARRYQRLLSETMLCDTRSRGSGRHPRLVEGQ